MIERVQASLYDAHHCTVYLLPFCPKQGVVKVAAPAISSFLPSRNLKNARTREEYCVRSEAAQLYPIY